MRRQKPAFGSLVTDAELLEAALIGLEHRRSEIDEKMAELRRTIARTTLSRSHSIAAKQSAPLRTRRTLSAAAPRRIASAQRRRWATVKKGQTAKAAPVKKRKLSAAARKRIAEATRKRWAEFRARKVAAKAAAEKKAAGKAAVKAAGKRGAA